MQWSMVALAAILAIASFLAALNHRKGRDFILRSSAGRSLHRSLPDRTRLTTQSSTPIMLCNGLPNLCDLPANKIVYATLHNANSATESGSVLFHEQVQDLEKAITAGYRGINMDIGKCFGKVRLMHGTCLIHSEPITPVLKKILNFLDANPHEVLIMPVELTVQIFLGAEIASLAEIDAVFQSVPGWKEKLYDHPGPGHPWPTLRELIAADTRILFFYYNGYTCTKQVDCPKGFHPWFRYAAETQFSFQNVAQLQDVAYSCKITRGKSGTRDFFGVNDFVTPAQKMGAVQVNQANFLNKHIKECSVQNGGQQVNLILVNYWDIGDLLTVVKDLNAKL